PALVLYCEWSLAENNVSSMRERLYPGRLIYVSGFARLNSAPAEKPVFGREKSAASVVIKGPSTPLGAAEPSSPSPEGAAHADPPCCLRFLPDHARPLRSDRARPPRFDSPSRPEDPVRRVREQGDPDGRPGRRRPDRPASDPGQSPGGREQDDHHLP